jgi:uncharacterized protein
MGKDSCASARLAFLMIGLPVSNLSAARRPLSGCRTSTSSSCCPQRRNWTASAHVVEAESIGGTAKPKWQCMKGCGACCFLGDYDDETLSELLKSPSDVEAYLSMISSSGWCRHFDFETRNCEQYENRPTFCRVEFDVFSTLYGVETEDEMDKFAIKCCNEHISSVYPSLVDDELDSKEMLAFRELTS